MLNTILSSVKSGFHKDVIIWILIISYLATFCSCETTGISNMSPEIIEPKASENIVKIKLNNGEIINCKDKSVTIEKNPDSSRIFVLAYPDTLSESDNTIKIQKKEERIQESDVSRIQMEITKINSTQTMLLVSGIVCWPLHCIFTFSAGNNQIRKISLNVSMRSIWRGQYYQLY